MSGNVAIITPINVGSAWSKNGLSWLKKYATPAVFSQTHKDWTWYVVSEGVPEPGVREYVDSLDNKRVAFAVVPRVLPEGMEAPNYDKVDAINAVLSTVKDTADYLAFLEPNYAWHQSHLDRLVSGLKRNGRGDFAYCKTRWDMYDRHVGFKGFAFNRRRLINRDYIPSSCVVYRRQARHGYYFQKNPNHPPFYAFLRQYILSNPDNGLMWLDEPNVYCFDDCTEAYVDDVLKTAWRPKGGWGADLIQTLNRVNLYLGYEPRFLVNWTNIGPLGRPESVDFNLHKEFCLSQKWPFDDYSVDSVFVDEYIERVNVEEGRHIIKEARRILKTGGILRIVTKNLEELIQRYAQGRDCDQFNLEIRNLSYTYSPEHLIRLIGDSGFQGASVLSKGESTKEHLRGLDRDEGDSLFRLEAWK